jgi:hypothetical protein
MPAQVANHQKGASFFFKGTDTLLLAGHDMIEGTGELNAKAA